MLCFQGCFVHLGPLKFHMNSKFRFSISINWFYVSLLINIGIWRQLTLLTYEHRISFHLFRSSLISFSNILWALVYIYFGSLIKLILRYFISLDVIVNQIETELILVNPANLLNFHISSSTCDFVLAEFGLCACVSFFVILHI
jgi:hypothetical protein